MTYAKQDDIENILGYTFDDDGTSRPTATQVVNMLEYADAIINAEARRTTNATDTSKRLKVIATSLVLKMITDMFALTDPERYGFIEVELNDDQKRIIHMEHSVWDAKTWSVADT